MSEADPANSSRRNTVKVATGLTAGVSSSAASCAGTPRLVVDAEAAARIDAALSDFVREGVLIGASALVFECGREAYFGAFGLADREARRPMQRNTIAQIFSMTKPITGVALMTLYDQGRFELDDPVADYLPEFAETRVFRGAAPSGEPLFEQPHRPMTIRDLTRHTAGFGPLPGETPLYLDPTLLDRDQNLAGLCARLSRRPLFSQPGQLWLYGPATDVQAHLVERLSGLSFIDYLNCHLFEPLGMTETRYFVPAPDRDRVAATYLQTPEGELVRDNDESGLGFYSEPRRLTPGSYGLTSTLDDYMRFALMLQNEGEVAGARILKPDTVRLMATDALPANVEGLEGLRRMGDVGFGIDVAVRLGVYTDDEDPRVPVGEFFWDGMASTLFWVDPANDVTAVFFAQRIPSDPIGLHNTFRRALYGP